MKAWFVFLTLALSWHVVAATIAVIDLEFDLKHEIFSGGLATNHGEIPDNGADDDGNGRVDDVHGWNFVDDNARLIDESLWGYFPDWYWGTERLRDIYVGEQLLSKVWREHPSVRWGRAGAFIKFFHGTFLSGIALGDGQHQVLPVRFHWFPPSTTDIDPEIIRKNWNPEWTEKELFEMHLDIMAKRQDDLFRELARYLRESEAKVAVMSIAMNPEAVARVVNYLYRKLPRDQFPMAKPAAMENFNHVVIRLIGRIAQSLQGVQAGAPGTLFIFAAGNEGKDNDRYLILPAGARASNSMVIAAADGEVLAEFSNFGRETVDLAAQGVDIRSGIPGGGEMVLSGTSQATGVAAMAAGLVADLNDDLSPQQIRQILTGTVDVHPALQGKLISGGVLNQERAQRAAAETLL